MGRQRRTGSGTARVRRPLLTEQWHTETQGRTIARGASVPRSRWREDGARSVYCLTAWVARVQAPAETRVLTGDFESGATLETRQQARATDVLEDTGPLRADPCHPLRNTFFRKRYAPFAGVLLAVASGCGTAKQESNAKVGATPLSVHAAEASTEVTLTLRPGTPGAGSSAELELRVVAATGSTLEIEDYQRSVENSEKHFEFRMQALERRLGTPIVDAKREWVSRFRVEFLLAGEYEFPPVRVTVTPAASNAANVGSSEPIAVSTMPLKVTVAEAPGPALTPDELRTLTMPSPVDLPRPWPRFWPAYVALGALGAIALAMFLVARRRRRESAEVMIPAHEWARRMFTGLIADDLLAQDRAQEFFYRISGIVRGYIERRFGLTAAEMTTEEFLSAASTDARFPRDHAAALDPFLRACDLVKYAKHQPRPSDADESLRAAQGFVEETREQEASVETSSPAADRSTQANSRAAANSSVGTGHSATIRASNTSEGRP